MRATHILLHVVLHGAVDKKQPKTIITVIIIVIFITIIIVTAMIISIVIMSAHPSRGSWPHRELHRRPQGRRPHASAPLIDPNVGTPLTRIVGP